LNTIVKRLYEGLFLVDSGEAASDWKGVNQTIEKILDRAGAEVVSIKKWDERRLAYEISGKSRGTYILAYFHCDPTNIAAIERTVQLNEQIMRVLVLRTDRMSTEDIERATPAMVIEAEAAAAEAKTAAVVEAAKAAAKEPASSEDKTAEPSEQPVEVVAEPSAEAPKEAPKEAEEAEPSEEDKGGQ
jgi:small subunit ribosomal protein S6